MVNIITKKKTSEEASRHVASPDQIERLKEQLHETEEMIKKGGLVREGEHEYNKEVDMTGHVRHATSLRKAIENNAPLEMSDKERDAAEKFRKEAKDLFKDNAPTLSQMNVLTDANMRHHKRWLNTSFDIAGKRMTGKQIQDKYQKLTRSMPGIDPADERLENYRRD